MLTSQGPLNFRSPSSSSFRTQGVSNRPPIVCHECGQAGHIRPQCPRLLGTYFTCRKTGHFARNCLHGDRARSESGLVQQPRGGQSSSRQSFWGNQRQQQPHSVKPRQLRDLRLRGERVRLSLLRVLIIGVDTFRVIPLREELLLSLLPFHLHHLLLLLRPRRFRINPSLFVETPIRGRSPLDRICWDCELIIQDRSFTFNFIVLNMSGFNLILGMDWLSTFHGTIDCFKHRVRICPPGSACFKFFGECRESLELYLCGSHEHESIYALLASLALDEDVSARGELPLVVCDFPDVFLKELPGLPPERD
ncbi:uncharacterized protein LOC131327610 [Rhododendron vialii]|uniref:uncharacterized protein LOC131327610 n=1 Tax=Rhododendron vialii TaxID=182163 RepID=UPI0026603E2C|nr:uncharacterized protein LOC131327610 [Rhododendron vialii]